MTINILHAGIPQLLAELPENKERFRKEVEPLRGVGISETAGHLMAKTLDSIRTILDAPGDAQKKVDLVDAQYKVFDAYMEVLEESAEQKRESLLKKPTDAKTEYQAILKEASERNKKND